MYIPATNRTIASVTIIMGLNCGIRTITTITANNKISMDGRKSSITLHTLDIVNQIRLRQEVLSATIAL